MKAKPLCKEFDWCDWNSFNSLSNGSFIFGLICWLGQYIQDNSRRKRRTRLFFNLAKVLYFPSCEPQQTWIKVARSCTVENTGHSYWRHKSLQNKLSSKWGELIWTSVAVASDTASFAWNKSLSGIWKFFCISALLREGKKMLVKASWWFQSSKHPYPSLERLRCNYEAFNFYCPEDGDSKSLRKLDTHYY